MLFTLKAKKYAPSYTKKGPGRCHRQGGQKPIWTAGEKAAKPIHKSMIGRDPRRVWLGGISAMRGW